MKIAIFSDFFYPELSGVADSITSTACELAKLGHTIDFFVSSYNKKDYETSGSLPTELDLGPNITIHRGLSFSIPTPTLQGRAYIPHLFRSLLPHTKFDIVHSHAFFGAGIDAWLFAKFTNTPLISTNHTLIESFNEYLPRKSTRLTNIIKSYLIWYYNQSRLVSAPSQFLLDDMKKGGLTSRGIVVSNPIDTNFFDISKDKDTLKIELGLSPHTVIYVGRLSIEKNVEFLLDAFIPFAKDHPDANLVFLGGGILRSKLLEKIEKTQLQNQIFIVGPFIGADKHKLYEYMRASDIFVTASTSETQSMTVLQGMAENLPIIAAQAAALPEVVGSTRGYMFDPSDKRALTQCFQNSYNDRLTAATYSENCKVYAKERTADKIADIWENIYRDTINV